MLNVINGTPVQVYRCSENIQYIKLYTNEERNQELKHKVLVNYVFASCYYQRKTATTVMYNSAAAVTQ